jgi:PIN domain nuclease of toxin-antitoxin system
LATKERLGKLSEAGPAVANFVDWVERDEFKPLPLLLRHGLMAGMFTATHGDPFDRMLAAQSIVEEAPILSRDTQLDAFGCERIWA